ncbi:MAG TPA: hypothetical protein VGE74_29730 [Gemmata sp.]
MSDPNELTGAPAWAPVGSTVQRVEFATERTAGQTVLMEFPAPVNRLAVLADGTAPEKEKAQPHDERLVVLSVPGVAHEDADLLSRARDWVDASALGGTPSQVLTLQGAVLVWAQGRTAVLAPAERLDAVTRALIEFAYYDAELRAVERELGALWPHLTADAPLAFEFNERSVRGRRRLAERFQQVLALRARLARITPHVLCPHVHPPTLASQVGERLRERARLAHRLESVGGQMEVFERVYEACGQRASDFVLARTGHTLEWVIIILLLTQTILFAVELLTRGK